MRALYGTRCDGLYFRQHLRECMKMIDYTSCLEDPDLWIRKAVNNNRWEYYEYMLLYVENFLCVSRQPGEALEEVNKYFPMKASSIGPPKIYLR